MSECRRCSECVNMSHHWTPDCAPDDIGQYACKHCNARGDECYLCEGAGGIPRNDGEIVECYQCMGEGVIYVGESEGGWADVAAVTICDSLFDIEGEAGQASQVAQDPAAGRDLIIERIKEIICAAYADRGIAD